MISAFFLAEDLPDVVHWDEGKLLRQHLCSIVKG
jgi:hypothetical protein